MGHNIIAFDHRILDELLGISVPHDRVIDTLVLSLLLNQGRAGGHSLEAWGERLKFPKGDPGPGGWDSYTPQMLEYCRRDVDLGIKVFHELNKVILRNQDAFKLAIDVEHQSKWIALDMQSNGFKFNIDDCQLMAAELDNKLAGMLDTITKAFPPRVKPIREITPRVTKHGTISKSGISSWYDSSDYTVFSAGCPFTLVEWITFNPGSPKQVIELLNKHGWSPTDMTDSHIEAKKTRDKAKLEKFKVYGWKINEQNLSTLPESAPKELSLLVEYILTAARRRTLTEWMSAYNSKTGRIHGRFNPLGTRTHRCSHTNPNMGNIATKKSIKYNTPRLRELALEYGARMRSMWICDTGSFLVGTDMESAHLRIFAHLINDPTFTQALITGDKKLGTDPHSVNKRILGDICVDRDRSKTFIFTFLNGGRAPKVGQIFGCSKSLAEQALDRFVRGYPRLKTLKEQDFPRDASRGYFKGVDGRLVINDSEHLMMGMVLQNMESVLMKIANIIWRNILDEKGIKYKQVNWVHDEFVTEVPGPRELAEYVGKVQVYAIRVAGRMFNLRCPFNGETKIGTNWLEVH